MAKKEEKSTGSKKKLTWREYNLILLVLGIAIVLASYLIGYTKISEKNTEVESQIGTRKEYLTSLEDCYNNLPTYEKGIADSKANISKNLAKLPRVTVNDEDFLMYLMQASDAVGADLETVEFQESTLVGEFSCYVGDKVQDISAYQTTTTSNGTLTYSQLKAFLQYIYEKTNNMTFINSISISYNAETAKLSETVELSKYYIDYKGAEYDAPAVPSVAMGTSNPFGTTAS